MDFASQLTKTERCEKFHLLVEGWKALNTFLYIKCFEMTIHISKKKYNGFESLIFF